MDFGPHQGSGTKARVTISTTQQRIHAMNGRIRSTYCTLPIVIEAITITCEMELRSLGTGCVFSVDVVSNSLQ